MVKSAFTAQEKYELIVAFEDRQISVVDFCKNINGFISFGHME